MKLKKMSNDQNTGWYLASIIYLFCILGVALNQDITWDTDEALFALGIFIFSGLVGVIGLRLYIQNIDPKDIKSILGIK